MTDYVYDRETIEACAQWVDVMLSKERGNQMRAYFARAPLDILDDIEVSIKHGDDANSTISKLAELRVAISGKKIVIKKPDLKTKLVKEPPEKPLPFIDPLDNKRVEQFILAQCPATLQDFRKSLVKRSYYFTTQDHQDYILKLALNRLKKRGVIKYERQVGVWQLAPCCEAPKQK